MVVEYLKKGQAMIINNFAKTIFESNKDDKVAIIHDQGATTYAELEQYVKQFAYSLKEKNIDPGDRVLILMSDRIEWVVAFLGCMYIGAVPTVISPLLVPKKYTEAMDISRATAIVTDVDQKLINNKSITIFTPEDVVCSNNQLEQAHDFLPDEIAVINTSSGTTGKQKFIAHRHQNFVNYLNTIPGVFKCDQNSVHLCTSKLSHVAGFNVNVTITLGTHATAIIMEKKYTPTRLYQLMTKHKVTHFHSQPGVYAMMTTNKKSLPIPSLEFAGCYSQQYPIKIAVLWQEIYGCAVHNGYGMSECFSLTMLQTPYAERNLNIDTQLQDTSLGKPCPGVVCEIRNEQGITCEKNETGELYIHTPVAASYYLNNWEKSKETFVGKWIKTNDLVYLDDNDNIHYVCRKDNFVKINGLLVSMEEVEKMLMDYDGIVDSLVQVYKNKQGLDKLKAQVVVAPNVNIDIVDIRHFLLGILEVAKVPKYIEVIKELPLEIVNEVSKTPSGKKIKRLEQEVP